MMIEPWIARSDQVPKGGNSAELDYFTPLAFNHLYPAITIIILSFQDLSRNTSSGKSIISEKVSFVIQ